MDCRDTTKDGRAAGAIGAPPALPLARQAHHILAALAATAPAPALAAIDGATLLCERALLEGHAIGGAISSGGGCRLLAARDDGVALNLARGDDRDLLPALFGIDDIDPADDTAIARHVAQSDAAALVARGRSMGLALAAVHEVAVPPAIVDLATTPPVAPPVRHAPRVLDLSALWAGPLAGHLLWLAGAEVVKVESRRRPDAMRGDGGLFALLNQGKANVALDLADAADRAVLLRLIATADIVIEAARPRALLQLGIDAAALVRARPGLVWLTLTAHGAEGEAAHWVGFGDDTGVAGGLAAALAVATGRAGFVGDAIGDPLTGIHAARAGWAAWRSGHGGRVGLAMSGVVAACLAAARADDPATLDEALRAWGAGTGGPFPPVPRRAVAAPVAAFGADTRRIVEGLPGC